MTFKKLKNLSIKTLCLTLFFSKKLIQIETNISDKSSGIYLL